MDKVHDKSNVFYRSDLRKNYPVMVKGKGIYLYDKDGNQYIDAAAGISVVNVGFGVKEIVDAMAKQAMELQFVHTSFFTTEVQERLANKIISFLSPKGLTNIWFSLSGTEATEAALKVARQYHLETGNPGKYKVISRTLSYHGSTIGALSMSTAPSWCQPYVPYFSDFPHIQAPNCYRCPYGMEYPDCNIDCALELEKAVRQEGSQYISAFIAEPIITGSGGVLIPPPEYFKIVRSLCDKYNILFIADEVFTGIGRTGRNFGIDHWDVVPDIIATAKGLGGGYAPLGGTIVSQTIFNAILNGSGAFVHGLTFGGHPVCCATALATLEYIEKNNLIQKSAEMGSYFLRKLSLLAESPIVGEVRGRGLLFGIEFVRDKKTKTPFEKDKKVARAVANLALKKGLRIQPGVGSVDGILGDFIIIAPPFIITESEIDHTVDILKETIREIENEVSK
jgi:adenosylmethionine-8-amino-7-oxononanoate aminotransferase